MLMVMVVMIMIMMVVVVDDNDNRDADFGLILDRMVVSNVSCIRITFCFIFLFLPSRPPLLMGITKLPICLIAHWGCLKLPHTCTVIPLFLFLFLLLLFASSQIFPFLFRHSWFLNKNISFASDWVKNGLGIPSIWVIWALSPMVGDSLQRCTVHGFACAQNPDWTKEKSNWWERLLYSLQFNCKNAKVRNIEHFQWSCHFKSDF